ncbi:MAG: hypothetical protein NVS3B3_22090 [Aquirhabdus sp.]
MEHSLVIQLALRAFEVAEFNAEEQPQLASLLDFNASFFSHIKKTLINIPKAPDIFVSSQSGVVGRDFLFEHKNIVDLASTFPEGVAWPITMAAPTDHGLIATPMRVLIMVPLQIGNASRNLSDTIESSTCHQIWNSFVGEIDEGDTSVLFFGMLCTADGHWEYSPMCWIVSSNGSDIQEDFLIGVAPVLSLRAKADSISVEDALTCYVQEYLLDEIGCVLLTQQGQ